MTRRIKTVSFVHYSQKYSKNTLCQQKRGGKADGESGDPCNRHKKKLSLIRPLPPRRNSGTKGGHLNVGSGCGNGKNSEKHKRKNACHIGAKG